LVHRFQASRNSVREAIKTLETRGLLIIKPGFGVFVAEVNSRPMSESLSSFLRIQKSSINELTQARIILEPNIARLACEAMVPEDLLKLEKNIQETLKVIKSNSPSLISAKNIEFHSLIADAIHNTVISVTMKTLFEVVKEMTLEITDDLTKRLERSRHAIDYHKKILKAFREGNSQRAHDLVLEHILQIQEGFGNLRSKTQ
jgi:GntR family transcriptional repressor for pyruvate dehydrogenase complex